MPRRRDVLDDHVDIDSGVRERPEHAPRYARLVGNAEDGHLGLPGVVCDAGHDCLFEHVFLLDDPRALFGGEGGADVELDPVVASVLDGAQHQHACSGGGQLEHLLVRDRVELANARDDPRVGGEDALDVGIDLAHVCVERGCERDGRGIGAAAAERRHVAVGGDALEAGDDRDLASLERLVHAAAPHLDDARLAVARIGHDARLRPGERHGVAAEVVDRHRDERDRDPLARCEQHVLFARVWIGRDLTRQVDQPVRRVAHRRNDHADLVARGCRLDNAERNAFDLVGSGDRGAAVLLHDDAHTRSGAGKACTSALWSSPTSRGLMRRTLPPAARRSPVRGRPGSRHVPERVRGGRATWGGRWWP